MPVNWRCNAHPALAVQGLEQPRCAVCGLPMRAGLTVRAEGRDIGDAFDKAMAEFRAAVRAVGKANAQRVEGDVPAIDAPGVIDAEWTETP